VRAREQTLQRGQATSRRPDHEALDVGSRPLGRPLLAHEQVTVVRPFVDAGQLLGGVVVEREAPATSSRHGVGRG